MNGAPPAPALPSPTVAAEAIGPLPTIAPPPRASSPHPTKTTRKSREKGKLPGASLPRGLLDGAVPPINVLIVEDNIINLKLLEAFMKRLKVRWHTAMNGREAVNKWREGGFHLVLMDIQLPVMNGLEATKEIRRLERINGVGFGSASANVSGRSSSAGGETGEDADGGQSPEGEDRFMNSELFKSPVIIVALTASSLQSDRHEALAAGCNDFLTKVRFPSSLPTLPVEISNANRPTFSSPSASPGSNEKSWNGAVCKPSSTLTAGVNGKTSPRPGPAPSPTLRPSSAPVTPNPPLRASTPRLPSPRPQTQRNRRKMQRQRRCWGQGWEACQMRGQGGGRKGGV